MASQTKKRIQFIIGNPAIKSKQVRIVMMGANGPPGARKARWRLGSRDRRVNTPPATSANANSVPIFDRSASVPISKKPPGTPTTTPATHVEKSRERYFVYTPL